MSSNENPDPYLQLISEWEEAAAQLKIFKEKEAQLRIALCAGAFPNPKEGANNHKLPDGRTVAASYKINRNIDQAPLVATIEDLEKRGVANAKNLIKWTPELAITEWRSLSEEMKLVFSVCVIAKPGMPSLEIKPAPAPRGAKKK